HTRFSRDWSSDVCSSDLVALRSHDPFKMKMVVVGRVVFGAQHRVETLAGALLNDPEKFPLTIGSIEPSILDRDPPPILKHEAGDIDCRASGMRRATAGAGNIAARVAAESLDAANRRTENLPRRSIDAVAGPAGKGPAHLASNRPQVRYRKHRLVRRQTGQLHAADQGASVAIVGVRKGAVPRTQLRQFAVALSGRRRDRRRRAPSRHRRSGTLSLTRAFWKRRARPQRNDTDQAKTQAKHVPSLILYR